MEKCEPTGVVGHCGCARRPAQRLREAPAELYATFTLGPGFPALGTFPEDTVVQIRDADDRIPGGFGLAPCAAPARPRGTLQRVHMVNFALAMFEN